MLFTKLFTLNTMTQITQITIWLKLILYPFLFQTFFCPHLFPHTFQTLQFFCDPDWSSDQSVASEQVSLERKLCASSSWPRLMPMVTTVGIKASFCCCFRNSLLDLTVKVEARANFVLIPPLPQWLIYQPLKATAWWPHQLKLMSNWLNKYISPSLSCDGLLRPRSLMMTESWYGAVNSMQYPLFIARSHQLVNGKRVNNLPIGSSIEWCWKEAENKMNIRRRRIRQRKEGNLTCTSVPR